MTPHSLILQGVQVEHVIEIKLLGIQIQNDLY